jgi:hypothetical protein
MTKDDAGYAAALQEHPDIQATILHSLETLREQLHQLNGSNNDATIPDEPPEPVHVLEHKSRHDSLRVRMARTVMMVTLSAELTFSKQVLELLGASGGCTEARRRWRRVDIRLR